MALSEIHACSPAPRGALWYYEHIVTALESDAFDHGSTPQMMSSYLAVVLADREVGGRS